MDDVHSPLTTFNRQYFHYFQGLMGVEAFDAGKIHGIVVYKR